MKVKELRKILSALDPNTEIIMSQDPEGNGYYKLADVSNGTVAPSELSGYRIDGYYSDSHTDDQCCLEEGERKTFTKVICLWP